ncbi:MAG: NADH:ubiquinone reductase (Na(+)-transporting) subunit C [Bacteroidota bacterium]|nr:NADH:ubiquinone reductase (Na(+)-transporting) subunit C [Bacteroidota bacterium]
MRQSNTYIIVFSAVLTVILGGLLSLASVGLGPQQREQMDRDNKRRILAAVMDLGPNDDVLEIYENRIQSLVVDIDGNVVGSEVTDEMFIAEQINISKEFKKPAKERSFPVFKFMSEKNPDQVEAYIVPMNGNGLWNEISGFVSLETDLETIKGVVFDHVGETPGLGARITEGSVQNRYVGKKIIDEVGELVSIQMVKRETGDPSIYDDYQVDGLSGATMTANGVNDMLRNYFNFYQPYFQKVRAEGQDAGEENIDQETGGDEFTTDPESM